MLGGNNPFGVVLATLVGVPMYADIFGTIPVAGGPALQGRTAWHNSVLYDGCHNAKSAVFDYAPQGREAEAAGAVH